MSYRRLYIDIESAPNVAHVWGLWNQTVSLSQLRESGRMICFAAKWKGDERVQFYSEFHHGRDVMLGKAHQLLSEADVVVHYNGKRYDIPALNREFVLAGMKPPAPFQQLDLLTVVRKQFRFPSNKLSYVSESLGIGTKYSHEGHMLWVRCLAGERAAWNEMRKYNKQDVVLLEQLEDRLQGWLAGAPNARLVTPGDDVCPECGGNDLRAEGYSYTQSGVYQRWQCRECGRWSTSTRRADGTQVKGA